MRLAVGLLRFAFDLPERKIAGLLADGWHLPMAQSTVSRLSIEFLVRWRMLGEERLRPLLAGLAPRLLPIDGTVVHGGPVTSRARDARTDLTLWAEQLEIESKPEVVRFLRTFRGRFGVPALIVRDLSVARREAVTEVFPEVPQQEDHWHFLTDLGPLLLVDYEPLRHGVLAGEALARLAQWARTLPLDGRTLERGATLHGGAMEGRAEHLRLEPPTEGEDWDPPHREATGVRRTAPGRYDRARPCPDPASPRPPVPEGWSFPWAADPRALGRANEAPPIAASGIWRNESLPSELAGGMRLARSEARKRRHERPPREIAPGHGGPTSLREPAPVRGPCPG